MSTDGQGFRLGDAPRLSPDGHVDGRGWTSWIEAAGATLDTPDDDLLVPLPIIAWRVSMSSLHGDRARPVFPPVTLRGDEVHHFQYLDGPIFGPTNCWPTVDDLIATIRERQRAAPPSKENAP